MALDDASALETIRRRTLLREGSWCIVDVVESDGTIRRLPVTHPDPAKQQAAQRLAERWFPEVPDPAVAKTRPSPNVLARAEHGVGCLIVVPLVARAKVLGRITFVADDGDVPFSPADIALASDLADLCALALDNARQYRQARELGESAMVDSHAKSEFLGNVSHELMTPLNAIGGYVSLIEMGLRGPVSPEILMDLERIRRNQVQLLSLVSDILTFARSEMGRLDCRCSDVSVEAMLQDVCDMLDGAAVERQQRLVHQAGDGNVVMWADPHRVRQILMNLVMNAIKYAVTDRGPIVLSASSNARTVAIRVADSGPGIPTEKLDAIFDPFVQLADSVAGRGGVGLGLAISRELARAMNGELSVESRVDLAPVTTDDSTSSRTEVGTTFTLILPMALGR